MADTFDNADLSGAVFREVNLTGVRMLGVVLRGADIDGDITGLRVNGVEVAPLIEAELDRVREPNLAPGWPPPAPRTAIDCLHVIFNEEWTHHQFALRDLAIIDAGER